MVGEGEERVENAADSPVGTNSSSHSSSTTAPSTRFSLSFRRNSTWPSMQSRLRCPMT